MLRMIEVLYALQKFSGALPRRGCAFLLFVFALFYNASINAAEVHSTESLLLEGDLISQKQKPNIRDNISTVVIKGGLLVVAADEGADILVFKKTDHLKYSEAFPNCIPLDGEDCGSAHKGREVDIEGMAWGKKYLYVIGSHSRARKKVNSDKSADENKDSLETLIIEPTREQLFRLELDAQGAIAQGSKIKKLSLRNLFLNHRILSLFQPVPGKENGIDIEGLAVKAVDGEDQLYIGFRGPVLRGNHAMIMVLEFDNGKFKENKIKENPKIHYVNLGGRGIRGMTETGNGGFLLLAGPVGDAIIGDEKSRYQLFFWNGEDDDVSGVARIPLCNVPVPSGAKAEGIELLNKDQTQAGGYRFVVVYDGAIKGGATVFTCQL